MGGGSGRVGKTVGMFKRPGSWLMDQRKRTSLNQDWARRGREGAVQNSLVVQRGRSFQSLGLSLHQCPTPVLTTGVHSNPTSSWQH